MRTHFTFLALIAIIGCQAQSYEQIWDGMALPSSQIGFLRENLDTADSQSKMNAVATQLALQGVDLNFETSLTTRIGDSLVLIPELVTGHYLRSEDQSYWIDMMQGPDDAHRQIEIGRIQQMVTNSGFIRLDVQTKKPATIATFIRTPTTRINIGLQLPFAIPQSYADLPEEERAIVLDRLNTLRVITTVVTNVFAHPDRRFLAPSEDGLSAEARVHGLTQFWSTVKYNFAFFDQVPHIDWDKQLNTHIPLVLREQSDQDYYRLLTKMCASLQDGHTNVYAPAHIGRSWRRPQVRLQNLNGRAIVTNVAQSLVDDIPIGSELVKINGQSLVDHIDLNVKPYISASTPHHLINWAIRDALLGNIEEDVLISFLTPEGERRQSSLSRTSSEEEWTVVSKSSNQVIEFKKLPDNIGYLALNSFQNGGIVDGFRDLLDSLKTLDGLLIDLRRNGGGNSSYGYEILQYFTDAPLQTSKWKTREYKPAFEAWGRDEEWYEGSHSVIEPLDEYLNLPLVVMAGNNTASAAEDFLVALDGLKRAKIVGLPSFGSTGQPLFISLPGGGSARICTKRDTYPDGREFVGYGVQPDVEVKLTMQDLMGTTDSTLEVAIEQVKRIRD